MGGESNTGKPLLLSNDREADSEVSGPWTVLHGSVCYYRPKGNHRLDINWITWILYTGVAQLFYCTLPAGQSKTFYHGPTYLPHLIGVNQ